MALEKNNVVVVEHRFAVPPSRVFAALKEGRLFFNCGAWPQHSKFDFRVGGKYRAEWGKETAAIGEFKEIVADRRVAFTWDFEGEGMDTLVTIDLTADGSGCLAKIRHEGFKDKETAEAHEGGWTAGLKDMDNEVVHHVIKLDREFKVPVEMLFSACSTLSFFEYCGAVVAESTLDFRVGGGYRCKVPKGILAGKFLEIEKNKKIVMTWEVTHHGGKVDKPTKVSMEFGPWGDDGKHSYLELIHDGFTTGEDAVAHHSGWNLIVEKIQNRVAR